MKTMYFLSLWMDHRAQQLHSHVCQSCSSSDRRLDYQPWATRAGTQQTCIQWNRRVADVWMKLLHSHVCQRSWRPLDAAVIRLTILKWMRKVNSQWTAFLWFHWLSVSSNHSINIWLCIVQPADDPPCMKSMQLSWKLCRPEWVQPFSMCVFQMRIVCKDVTAETLYDVLHDTSYRKKWDTNMIDTYDIARLTANADIGYYSCQFCSGSTVTVCIHSLWNVDGL